MVEHLPVRQEVRHPTTEVGTAGVLGNLLRDAPSGGLIC